MRIAKLLTIALMTIIIIGCAGKRTFHDLAFAGDTVAVAVGWKHDFRLDNLTVTFTPTVGDQEVYLPGDPKIRAVTNLYVDPLASIIISREINEDQTPFASSYGSQISGNFTGDDKDWWQTVVFVDLPATLQPGSVEIVISNGVETNALAPATLDIVSGTGESNPLDGELLGPMTDDQLASLQRSEHYTVSFTASTIPHAIQIDLTHGADRDNGGTGKAYVVNPLGYMKGATWYDDGFKTRVILIPSKIVKTPKKIQDFKFYVAGRVTNLALATVDPVQAFDKDGIVVPGVSASITSSP
jgi:hypothetical protein